MAVFTKYDHSVYSSVKAPEEAAELFSNDSPIPGETGGELSANVKGAYNITHCNLFEDAEIEIIWSRL